MSGTTGTKRARTEARPTSLTPTQEKAAALKAAGVRTGKVAKAIAVDRTTVGRWAKSPEFQAEEEARREALRTEFAEGVLDLVRTALAKVKAAFDAEPPEDGNDPSLPFVLPILRMLPPDLLRDALAPPSIGLSDADLAIQLSAIANIVREYVPIEGSAPVSVDS